MDIGHIFTTIGEQVKFTEDSLLYYPDADDLILNDIYSYLNKEGYLFTKTIMTSYSKGIISYGEMCHTLNVGSCHIDKMERAVMFV